MDFPAGERKTLKWSGRRLCNAAHSRSRRLGLCKTAIGEFMLCAFYCSEKSFENGVGTRHNGVRMNGLSEGLEGRGWEVWREEGGGGEAPSSDGSVPRQKLGPLLTKMTTRTQRRPLCKPRAPCAVCKLHCRTAALAAEPFLASPLCPVPSIRAV